MCQILERMIWINYFLFMQVCKGLPWRSSGQDSIFLMQGAQVPSLGRKLDPHVSSKSSHATTKTHCSKISNKEKKEKSKSIKIGNFR